MFDINDKLLKDIGLNDSTLLKGKQYFANKRVIKLHPNESYNTFRATVAGTRNYSVEIYFNENESFSRANCTCPAYDEYWGYCKHIVATLLEIKKREQLGQYSKQRDNQYIKNLMELIHNKNTIPKRPLQLEITYEYDSSLSVSWASSFAMRIGETKLYIVKNPKELINSMDSGKPLLFGKEFIYDSQTHYFKAEDQVFIDFLKELYEYERFFFDKHFGYHNRGIFSGKKVYLTPTSIRRFFEAMKKRSFHFQTKDTVYKNMTIVERELPLNFTLERERENLVLQANNFHSFMPLSKNGEYYFVQNEIYKIPPEQREGLLHISEAIKGKTNSIIIPKEYKEKFISEVYPLLKRIGKTTIDEEVQSDIYGPPLEVAVYLDFLDNKLFVEIKFLYGDMTVYPFGKGNHTDIGDNRILIRDYEKENQIIIFIEDTGFKIKNNEVYLDDEGLIFDFVHGNIRKIQKLATVFYSEAFKRLEIKDKTALSGAVRFTGEGDTLEFNFDIEGISSQEITEVFKSIREKKKYYRLKDGSFLPLDLSELVQVEAIIDSLGLDGKDMMDGTVFLPRYRALFIDEQLKEANIKSIKRSREIKEFVQNIREPVDGDYEIPENLKDILREYQKTGFRWLKTLSAYGLGGILADDMGLGKTLQVLTLLLSEKEEQGALPSIIVAPTSLVYNWACEIEKFTPELKALVVAGNKTDRAYSLGGLENYDVLITSYPLIRRDVELYQTLNFKYCILDEAQHIKNPASVSAKSVKEINAKNYFALTGTPIENSLTELWSIFDFIMPNYLLSMGKFQRKFEKPIINEGDQERLSILGKHIRPFIMRRLKRDVLKELPEKLENTVVAELTIEQKKLYLAYLKQIKGEIQEEIKNKGFQKSHIKILSGLTRLRQICCHPAMFIDDYRGGSGKLELLEEIIRDALDSGHRLLLFSQFTTMLHIIKNSFESMGISYKYLDGSTEIKTRGHLVRQFNDGEGEVFLISLKAGGTGLNLTGADMVIHFDPWWNPAVEDQATDRAYRIGQQNTVHVMKFVTLGTIEEKILNLQDRKKKLIDSVIEPGETLVSKLSESEIRELFELE